MQKGTWRQSQWTRARQGSAARNSRREAERRKTQRGEYGAFEGVDWRGDGGIGGTVSSEQSWLPRKGNVSTRISARTRTGLAETRRMTTQGSRRRQPAQERPRGTGAAAGRAGRGARHTSEKGCARRDRGRGSRGRASRHATDSRRRAHVRGRGQQRWRARASSPRDQPDEDTELT